MPVRVREMITTETAVEGGSLDEADSVEAEEKGGDEHVADGKEKDEDDLIELMLDMEEVL